MESCKRRFGVRVPASAPLWPASHHAAPTSLERTSRSDGTARSIGAEPRVHDLRAITDDVRWTLAGHAAAGLLAYHEATARDTDHRWQRLATIRDTMMAENLHAIADRGPTLVFVHNQHLRTGTTWMSLGPMTLRWQPASAHLADRLGSDYLGGDSASAIKFSRGSRQTLIRVPSGDLKAATLGRCAHSSPRRGGALTSRCSYSWCSRWPAE